MHYCHHHCHDLDPDLDTERDPDNNGSCSTNHLEPEWGGLLHALTAITTSMMIWTRILILKGIRTTMQAALQITLNPREEGCMLLLRTSVRISGLGLCKIFSSIEQCESKSKMQKLNFSARLKWACYCCSLFRQFFFMDVLDVFRNTVCPRRSD